MNRSLLKDTVREIWKTKSKFFSIFAIVAIGVGFFAGIQASPHVMRANADKYFDDYNLMDYRILSNFGLTKEDIKEIEKINGVESVFPAYEKDVLVTVGSSQTVMRIHSLDFDHLERDDEKYINQLNIIEGRLPRRSGEIVVEYGKLLANDFKVGDTITISSGDSDDIYDTFSRTEFTIVGTVESVYYLSYTKGSSNIGSGNVGVYAYCSQDDFDMEVYTEAFVTVENAREQNSYTDRYFELIQPVTDKLKTLGTERSDIRRQDILDEAWKKYNEGEQEYLDGLEEFNTKIADAEKEISDGEKEILKNEILISTNRTVAQAQFESAQATIDSYKETLATVQEYYDEMKTSYDDNFRAVIEARDNAEKELNKAKKEEAEKQAAFDDADRKYQALVQVNEELSSLQSQYSQKQTSLAQRNADLISLQTQLILANEEDKPQIQAQIDAKNIEIETLNSEISDITDRIATINSENPTLSGDIAVASAERTAAETELVRAKQNTQIYQRTYDAYNQTLDTRNQGMDTVKAQIDSIQNQIDASEKTLADTKRDTEKKLADGEAEIARAKIKLADGRIELEKNRIEGQEKLDDAYDELVRAKADIESIENAEWYVLDREKHYSYMDYRGATERMDAISKIFPLFFFAVSALVCLTTMTRMVDEQRTQIGTLKALGYKASSIAFKYIFYRAFASVLGSALGLAFGSFAFPYVIYTAWNMMYTLPPMKMFYIPWILVISARSIIFVTTSAAFAACYNELVETPSVLMRPKTPKLGKKIFLERVDFIWKRLSFTSKVTARNLFRYKKRFLMTVIGIAGCSALLVTGYGIKDSINQLVQVQFGEIFFYDGSATLSRNTTSAERQKLISDIESSDEIYDAYGIYKSAAIAYFDDASIDVTLTVVTDMDHFDEYACLRDRKSKADLNLTSDGAIISEHTANKLGLKAGDEIQIKNEDGMISSVKITAICENYIDHYVYMTSSYYKSLYDIRAIDNTLLIKKAEGINDADARKVISMYNIIDTVGFHSGTINNFNSMINSLDYIVLVLIVSSGALAFVVLYNLTNVNVSERMREIATLKVLGFRQKEVQSYIYRENLILTFIGSVFGLLLGKVLHHSIMVLVELDTVMFGRNIGAFSYVISVFITMMFALIVDVAMKKRLENVEMVESLKSVE